MALGAVFAGTPGFRCVGAIPSAGDALRLLPVANPHFAIVGLCLADMGGPECVFRLRQKLPRLQVVALSHFHQPEQLFDALKAGAAACVLKPAAPAKLIEAVEAAHHGGSWASPSLSRLIFQYFRNLPDAGTPAAGNLTVREREIILLAKHGLSNEQIAKRLCVKYHTIRTHLRNIYEKMGVRSRAEAVAKHFRL
jgi:DNA-binding NarL/FixJ family response regulator